MKTLKLLLVVLMLGSFTSCKDDDGDTDDPKIAIKGITVRDDEGNIAGSIDPADWNLNSEYNDLENKLFPSTNLPICADHADSSYTVSVYPNPNDGVFVFGSIVPHDHISVRIVDENLKILYSNDSITGTALTITEDKDGGKRAVRLYYRIFNENCIYQGYGDISIR